MLMIQLIAVIASLFIRETKNEEALLNHCHELEKDTSLSIPYVNEPPQPEKIQNPQFTNILNQLGGLTKEGSKLGTLVGSPRNHMDIKLDFEMPPGYNLQNALQFENSIMPIDQVIEEQEQEASSSSSSSEDEQNNVHEQLEELSSGLDEDDYEEVDEENEVDRYQFQYGFSLPGEED